MMPLLLGFLLPFMAACGSASAKADNNSDNNNIDSIMTETANTPDTTSVKVKMTTSLGDVVILLYGDTPRHRDNFVKLVNEGFYNGTLFHRVINQFMIQTGDPDSKNAPAGKRLGSGGPGYTIEAEIEYPRHYHKRGALAAARQGDQVNPERRSSGSQFYIVTGRKLIPAQLQAMKEQLHNQQLQSTFNGLAAAHLDEIRSLQAKGDTAALRVLQEKLIAETEATVAAHPLTLTPEMEQEYVNVGGTPHLDGTYTVFGEVLEGMDVIDKIEKVETDSADRPVEDVKIISMEVLK